jgi:hypothetical protein
MHASCLKSELGKGFISLSVLKVSFRQSRFSVGSTLALAQPHYYDRLVQLASTIKFVHHITFKEIKVLLLMLLDNHNQQHLGLVGDMFDCCLWALSAWHKRLY